MIGLKTRLTFEKKVEQIVHLLLYLMSQNRIFLSKCPLIMLVLKRYKKLALNGYPLARV